MRPKGNPAATAKVRVVGPAEMGFVPRPDLGPRVWETPGGGLHQFASGEQIMMIMHDDLPDWGAGVEHGIVDDLCRCSKCAADKAAAKEAPLTINEVAHGDETGW